MEQALRSNPAITAKIVRLFETHFDPASGTSRNAHANRLKNEIKRQLERVASADEDRILRRFLNGVEATLRTNCYQTADDGGPKSYLSIKLDSSQIDDLPLPRPLREIFVYAPRFEAIHLRGGMVARGGLRWSDRPEDFRTEVLGLVKAQMVKNAVIVPLGSKGGFVLKRPPASGGREALLEEGIACYKMFMSGMLDITDNYRGNKVEVRKDVVRRDGDDPYLVVAADKGTATFSDIANGVSAQYGHWLETRTRLGAVLDTITKKWVSPPGVPGSRLNVISEKSAKISSQKTSQRWASATCRAMSLVMACCSPNIFSCSVPLITCTSL